MINFFAIKFVVVVVVVVAQIILLSTDSVRRQILDVPRSFHCNDCLMIGGIRTCLGVSSDPIVLWIFSISRQLNLLLVRSYQAKIIIVKRLIQGRKTWPGCELKPGHAIRNFVKTTPLPSRPRCRQINFENSLDTILSKNTQVP